MSPWGDLHLLRRFSATTDAVLQLLDAGYPFQKAILLLADFEKEADYRERLTRMSMGMDQGIPFHVTLAYILPQSIRLAVWDVASLPDMRAILMHLGTYVSQKEHALRTLFRSLIYPVTLLLGLFLVLLLFVFQVVPAMGALVGDANASSLLGGLLGLRLLFLQHAGMVLVGFCLVTGLLLWWMLGRGWSLFVSLWFRPRGADVAWLMGILLSNGVSMEISLAALVMASNRPEIRWLQADVLQSGQFVPGFLRFFRVTGIQSQLLLASEKSGTLSLRLVSAGQVLMAEDMAQLSRRIGLVQPFLLILVGVMVWFLMQVVMAPMSTMIQML